MRDIAALQDRARADGKVCVVAALIRDDAGRVFVHRRGPDRRFLPNCWDLVGGHVEAGEDLLTALLREVREETGWALRGDPELLHIEDWDAPGEVAPEPHREFDFLVEVQGDLARPQLEWPKHVEYRWIAQGEEHILDENRGMDGGYVRRVFELALRT